MHSPEFPSSQTGMSEQEARHLFEAVTANGQLNLMLLHAGQWQDRVGPVSTFTTRWNADFFRNFYPDLERDDVIGFRSLARIEGQSWVDLKSLVYFYPMQEALGEDQAVWEINYFEDKLRAQIDGSSPLSWTPENHRASTSPAVRRRLEEGMSRPVRVFGALVAYDKLKHGGQDNEWRRHLPKVHDILGLTDTEIMLTNDLYEEVLRRRDESHSWLTD